MQMKIRKSFILLFSAVIAVMLFGCALMFAPKTTAHADTEETHDHSTMTAINSYADIENGELTTGAYVLTDNIDCNISVAGEVTLCLNGKTVTGSGNGSVITVSGNAMFTLCDCVGTGVITGGNATDGGGVYMNTNSTFTMMGGTISGNTASDKGGGVRVYGTFIMNGGEIKNNTATEGGGVHVRSTQTFEMTGGTISGNSATDGSGVYVAGYFKMSGGTISDNTASEDGGGVYVYLPKIALPLPDAGSGAHANGFDILGAPKITGNSLTDGSHNNVFIVNGKTACVIGELTEGAQIGVNNTGIVAKGFTYNGSDKPSKYFIPDNPKDNCVYVSDEDSGTVSIGHDWDEGTVTTQPTCTAEGEKTFTCSVCGETKTEPVEALGHTEESVNAVSPSCTENGSTAGKRCSVCNTVLEGLETVEALIHSYGEWTTTKEATETEEGEERRVCANDETHYETRTIPKLTPSTPTPTPEKPSAPAEETKSYWWLFWLLIPLAIGVGGVTLGIWVYKDYKKKYDNGNKQ